MKKYILYDVCIMYFNSTVLHIFDIYSAEYLNKE